MLSFRKLNYRQKIIAIFTFLGGLYYFIYFILSESILDRIHLKSLHGDISLGFNAIGMLTFGLGIINLMIIHGGKVIYVKKGWFQSVALITAFCLMIIFSVLDWKEDYYVQKESYNLYVLSEFSSAIIKDEKNHKEGIPEISKRIESLRGSLEKELKTHDTILESNPFTEEEQRQIYTKQLSEYNQSIKTILNKTEPSKRALSLEEMSEVNLLLMDLLSQKRELLGKISECSFSKKFYNFIFEGLFVSLGSAMFSLLGVYIAAAAYRAFRIKTWESSLMMLSALIVMLGQTSFGTSLYSGMPALRSWLLEVPNSAVARAIAIGASVAGLIMAIRMWFSIESDSFSGKKE